MEVRAFVQARMSSRRFPGKVLAPFRGRPILAHVVGAVREALPAVPIVVVTSSQPSDDPLALYAKSLDVAVFRGPLDDVFGRFRQALAAHPAARVLRICADSPLLSPNVLRLVTGAAESGRHDLVTTTARRTFPKGENAEVIRAETLLALDPDELDDDDREHVTRFLHRHPERFRILNVESGQPELAELDHAVDTIDDLARLEALGASDPGIRAVG